MISTTIVWRRRSSWRLFFLISLIFGVWISCSLIPSVKCTVTSYKSYPELWRGRRNLSPAVGHFDSRMRQTQSQFDTSPYYYYFNKRMGEEQTMGNGSSVSDIVFVNTNSSSYTINTGTGTSDNNKVLDINSSDAWIRNGNVPLRGKFRRRRVKKRRNGTIIPVEDKFFPQLNDSESVGLDSTTSSEMSTILSTTEDSVTDTESTTTENYTGSTDENVIFDDDATAKITETTETPTKDNDISVKTSSSGETYEIVPLFMRPGIWNDKGNSLEIIASTTPAGTKRRRKMRMQRRRKRPNAINNLNNHKMFEYSGSGNNLLTNSAVSDLYSSESANPYVHNGSTPISSDLRNTLLFDHLNYFHPLLTADSIVSSKEKRPEDKNVAIEHSLSDHVDNIPVAHDLIYTKPHPLFNLDSVISSKEEISKSRNGPNYFYPSSSFYDSENTAREIITESTTSRGDPMETFQFDISEHDPTTYKPHVSISPTLSSKRPPTILLPKKPSITTTTTTTKVTSKPTVITTARTTTTIKTTTTTTPPPTTTTRSTPQRTRGTITIKITPKPKPTPKPYTEIPQQQKATTNPDTHITLTSSFKSNPQKEAENIRQSIIIAQQNKIKEEKAVVKTTTTKLTTPKPILTTQATTPTTTTNMFQQLLKELGSSSQTTKLPGTDIFSNLFTTPSTTTSINSQINNNAGLSNLFGLNQNPTLTNSQHQQNGGLNDIFNLLNIFQPQATTTVAPFVVKPSLGSQDASPAETAPKGGSSLEELTAQLELLEGLVKGLSIHSADQNQQSATNGHVHQQSTNGASSSSSGGLSEADLKSIFSLIDSNQNQQISTIKTTSKSPTTTTTTTPKPTTTTAKPTHFTIPTTTLHPVLKNMLDIFTGGITPQNQNSQIDFNNLFGTTSRPQVLSTTTLKPFLDSVLNAIQQQQPNESQNQQQNVKVPPPSTTATSSKDPTSDLFAQLLNLGLAADNLQQQSNSVRSPPPQQQQPATVLGPQPIPSFDLASLFGLNNFAAQLTTTTQAPRIQQQNPLDLSQLLNLFGGNNNGGNNNFLQPQPQKRQSPTGLYYWLDLNTFFGGDPTTEPFSGFRPKLGARDHFIRVQRNTVADKRDGGYFG